MNFVLCTVFMVEWKKLKTKRVQLEEEMGGYLKELGYGA